MQQLEFTLASFSCQVLVLFLVMYVQDIRQNVSDIKNNESFQLDGKKCKQKGKKFIFA
jgi:hypothetical protein